MEDVVKIKELRRLAEEWLLEDREILDKYTNTELAEIYNGIGPEAFPSWLRNIVSALNPTLEPVALIHDVEWHETDGTKETWHATNDRFKRNGITAAKRRYPWWHILRYRVRRQASLFRVACETRAGWLAWCDGAKKPENKEEEK